MIDWPESLVSDIARRRTVIVVGSGVSRHSIGNEGVRPPTWKAFLTKALNECPDKSNLNPVREALEAGDFLHACEWLKRRFDENWIGFLRRTFSAPAYAPAEIHKLILNLDARVLFTLNFDDIYERHAGALHFGSHIVKNYYDIDVSEFLRGGGRYIVKVHGSLNQPNQIIFTQEDYSRARVNHSSFYQAFDAALLAHTFLFLGSGYSDPDINLILENQNVGFPASSPHYFVTADGVSSDRSSSLRKNRNLKVLTYDPIDDDHTGILPELSRLCDLVESERFNLTLSTNW